MSFLKIQIFESIYSFFLTKTQNYKEWIFKNNHFHGRIALTVHIDQSYFVQNSLLNTILNF